MAQRAPGFRSDRMPLSRRNLWRAPGTWCSAEKHTAASNGAFSARRTCLGQLALAKSHNMNLITGRHIR
jgi:hypothetical protein